MSPLVHRQLMPVTRTAELETQLWSQYPVGSATHTAGPTSVLNYGPTDVRFWGTSRPIALRDPAQRRRKRVEQEASGRLEQLPRGILKSAATQILTFSHRLYSKHRLTLHSRTMGKHHSQYHERRDKSSRDQPRHQKARPPHARTRANSYQNYL